MSRHVMISMLLGLLILPSCVQFQTSELKVPPLPGLRFVEVNGWRIRVDEVGQGKPLVLIHGYSSTLEEWRPALKYLCQSRRCILMDLPGFGLSDKWEGDYSPQTMARYVAAVMDSFGVASADIVAHSWGCSVALSLAAQFPLRVESLVLTGAWVYKDQLPTFLLWARVPVVGEFLFTAFFSEQPEMRYQEVYYNPDLHVKQEDVELMQLFLTSPGAVRAALQAARDQRFEDIEPIYETIVAPTLVISCEEDRVALPFYSKRLVSEMPNARFQALSQCGHVPQVENPESYAHVVLGFLDRGQASVVGGVR